MIRVDTILDVKIYSQQSLHPIALRKTKLYGVLTVLSAIGLNIGQGHKYRSRLQIQQ